MSSKTVFYIVKRVFLALFTIWFVITITFFVMNAVPGGPFMSEKAVSEEAQAALEAKYGLDQPIHVQYGNYLKRIVTDFDFGPSIKQRGRTVMDIIQDGMETSVPLGLCAAGIALIFGVVLGSSAALRRNTVYDKGIMVTMTAFVSMPSFIMGTLLLLLFAVTLQWLPANGTTTAGLILPVIALSLAPMAHITRLTRSSMLDVLRPRTEELPHPRHHLFRAYAGVHRHRLSGGGEDLCGARHRPYLRQQYHRPRLSRHYGYHHHTGHPDRGDEPHQRYSV